MPDASSGLARYVALAILAFEVGKLARDHQTREFFAASGYPATLMFAVMTAEIVGAWANSVPARDWRRPADWPCSCSAPSRMHLRNGDPFADSLDALLTAPSIAGPFLMAASRRRQTHGEPARVQTAT